MSTMEPVLESTPAAGWSAARLGICLGVCFGAAAFGALFMPGAWYAGLAKPPLTPPNWVFGPVWTTLYLLMAIAAWTVWNRAGTLSRAARPAGWFVLQLVLNAGWSALFFGLHAPLFALIEIVVLWGTIAATIAAFARVSRFAAAMLVPYLAWVSLATYLNAGLWWLNRSG
jgi:benzodiazapine receptor